MGAFFAVIIELPENFNYEHVEVIIMPKDETEWRSEENIGKTGFDSRSFVDDPEDYSQW